jgi:acetyltransferase-like isoleucine patch superfamily enzyme
MVASSFLDRAIARVARMRLNRRLKMSCDAQETALFLGTASVINHQAAPAIRIGSHSLIGGELLVFPDSGRIRIGDYCFVGAGSRIWSAADVNIGNRVLISHNVNIHDTVSHSLHAQRRHAQFAQLAVRHDAALADDVPRAPIVIEDDAWIGLNAVILKGVRIGRGAIVAAGSVVSNDVAPYVIVGGAVAQPIGRAYE